MFLKRIFTILTAALFAAVTIQAQDNMILTERQQSLVEISALEAKGDMARLNDAIRDGLNNCLSVNEIKEALSQLYAYTGFPRSLNALGVLQQIVAENGAGSGNDYKLPANFNALQAGTEVQTKLCGGKPFDYKFAPQMDYYLKAHLFGDIFAGDILTESEREIVTISAISSLEGCGAQLNAHIRGGFNMGVTLEELQSIPAVLEAKVGNIEAYRVRKAIAEFQGREFAEGEPVDFNIWPKGEPNTGYAQYFIGESYLAALDTKNGGPVNVTFEPRCRNNWHIHRGCVQVLICVAGRGWYQEEGKEAVEMTPGCVIAIPEGAKHWHGAAKESWFQHLTYTANVQENAGTEWLGPVTDEVYDKLK